MIAVRDYTQYFFNNLVLVATLVMVVVFTMAAGNYSN